jgi:hypothetical protein
VIQGFNHDSSSSVGVGVYFNFQKLQHGLFGTTELLQEIQPSSKL